MEKINELFGSMVFNDAIMKERLPEETYLALKAAIDEGKEIDASIADVVAAAMKDWAIEKGATHFTHWFQPMTGITAEKHDSFIMPTGDGRVIMEFSGKELIKGEPDASSFPSGGLRATFEARGYTAWDPSSYAFVKDHTLCIPTAFCSFGGQALDAKTPLLRSMAAINKQALRITKCFRMDDVRYINTTVGAEQEYFLVDASLYDQRPDLIFCGRTLIGAPPPKGQETSHHYFGVIKPRVAAFMRELDEELWRLGVPAKTEHNEAAPAQHELAPVFTTTNIAADHNQLTMEMMKKVALRHGLVCLLNEKPFKGVNGSGKHNNWSISTDTGVNFLKPGKSPSENLLFLLTVAAMIEAVDKHQDLLRIAVATAGNDHRLGAHEAPPAIVSVFLGEELTNILSDIAIGVHHNDAKRINMSVGTDIIPRIRRDNADRNRTSPFAFTGNKFECRMLGSGSSISDINTMLNTMVADVFAAYADRLEKADDLESEVHRIIRDTMRDHGRIIFNGDGYSDEWREEAAKRGLLNLRSTVDAIPHLCDSANVLLFERHGVFKPEELNGRVEIALENYCKTLEIEGLTLSSMIYKDVIPAITRYTDDLCTTITHKKEISPDADVTVERELLDRLSALNTALYKGVDQLKTQMTVSGLEPKIAERARSYHDKVLFTMENLRHAADEAESLTAREYWPYPGYENLLFNI